MRELPENPIFGPENPRLDPANPPEIKAWRSLAKAISWRIVGTLDTLVLSFFIITFLGPLFGMAGQESNVAVLETASFIALTEVITKMALFFTHERLWEKIRWNLSIIDGKRTESYTRTAFKTSTWRTIASLDTFFLALIFTGNVGTAVSIGGLEIITKLILYFIHERVWVKIPLRH